MSLNVRRVIAGAVVYALTCGTVLYALSLQQPRDNRRPALSGTAAISGVVVAHDDNRGLRRARVSVSGSELEYARVAITDDDGRFAIEGLPAGRYSVTAAKDGYVAASAGATRPGRAGLGVEVLPGQMQRIDLRLPKAAAITGRLLTPEGEPAGGVTMVAMESRYIASAGERRLVPVGITAVTTDDRGIYRIFGLPPGKYVVAAEPLRSPGGSGGDVEIIDEAEMRAALAEVRRPAVQSRPGFHVPPPPARSVERAAKSVTLTSIYYPGTSMASRATVISLTYGEVRTGVDFDLAYVPAVRVEGFVGTFGGIERVLVTIMNADRAVAAENMRTTSAGRDGRFSFRGIAPGHYTIAARVVSTSSRPGSGIAETSLWGATEIIVSGDDLEGVSVPLRPPLTISGRLRFESASGAVPALGSLRLPPVQALNITHGGLAMLPPISVENDRFSLSGVLPGIFRLASPPRGVRAPIGNWWLKSVRINGEEMLDSELNLRQSADDAVITFSDRTTEVSGTAHYAGGLPVTDEFVVVFSRDPRHWFHHSRRVVGLRPSPSGNFTFRNLPPGEYLLAVTSELETNEWFDPEALWGLVPDAMSFRLGPDEAKRLDVVRPGDPGAEDQHRGRLVGDAQADRHRQ